MPEWGITVIASLCTALVSVAGVIGYLKNTNGRNPNGCKTLDSDFKKQVNTCNERFLEIAKSNGGVNTSLKNIERRLENIEGWLKK